MDSIEEQPVPVTEIIGKISKDPWKDKEVFWGPDFLIPENHEFILEEIQKLLGSGMLFMIEEKDEDGSLVTFDGIKAEQGNFTLIGKKNWTRNPYVNTIYNRDYPSVQYVLSVADNPNLDSRFKGIGEIELDVIIKDGKVQEVFLLPRHLKNPSNESPTFGVQWQIGDFKRKNLKHLANDAGEIAGAKTINVEHTNTRFKKILEERDLWGLDYKNFNNDRMLIDLIVSTWGL